VLFLFGGLAIGFAVGAVSWPQIVLPFLYSWPRTRRMWKQRRLVAPMPAVRFLMAVLLWSGILVGVWLGVELIEPRLLLGFDLGAFVALLMTLRYFFAPTEDMYADLRRQVSPLLPPSPGLPIDGSTPTHAAFVALRDQGLARMSVDYQVANRLSEQLPMRYSYRSRLVSLLWLISMPAALALAYWVTWWVGLASLFLMTPSLFRLGKAATISDVVFCAEDHEPYYTAITSWGTEKGLVRIEVERRVGEGAAAM
jgi:hypothetical protein